MKFNRTETMTGTELCQMRKSLNLTQHQLAQLWEITPTTISRWETGQVQIPYPRMVRLAFKGISLHQKKEIP